MLFDLFKGGVIKLIYFFICEPLIYTIKIQYKMNKNIINDLLTMLWKANLNNCEHNQYILK